MNIAEKNKIKLSDNTRLVGLIVFLFVFSEVIFLPKSVHAMSFLFNFLLFDDTFAFGVFTPFYFELC